MASVDGIVFFLLYIRVIDLLYIYSFLIHKIRWFYCRIERRKSRLKLPVCILFPYHLASDSPLVMSSLFPWMTLKVILCFLV